MTITDQIDRARRNFCAAFTALEPYAVAMHPTELEDLHKSRVAKHRIARKPEAGPAAIAYADLAILIWQGSYEIAGPIVMSRGTMRKLLALDMLAWG